MTNLRKVRFWIQAWRSTAPTKGERGASLVEYALLLALITVVCVVAIASMGLSLGDSYSTNNSSLFGP